MAKSVKYLDIQQFPAYALDMKLIINKNWYI